MYLINTMVLSELRRRQRDPGVVAWLPRPRSDLAPEHEQKGTDDRRPDQHAQGAWQGGAQGLGALIAEAAADAGGVDGDRLAELLFPLGQEAALQRWQGPRVGGGESEISTRASRARASHGVWRAGHGGGGQLGDAHTAATKEAIGGGVDAAAAGVVGPAEPVSQGGRGGGEAEG